jgi:hypothetical protein
MLILVTVLPSIFLVLIMIVEGEKRRFGSSFLSIDRLRGIFSKLGLLPQHSEVSAYLICFTFVLLFLSQLIDERFRILLWHTLLNLVNTGFFSNVASYYIILGWIVVVGVLGFIFYNAFSSRKKSKFEAEILITFIVIAELAVGISSAIYMLAEPQSFLAIFPAWNLFHATILLYILKHKIIDKSSFIDNDSNLREIITGSFLGIAIFILFYYIYELNVILVLAVTIGYVPIITEVVSRFTWPILTKHNR